MAPAAMGLLLFAFYAWGMYPGVSVGDSGEFITAAATLGIPHPPGFSTYVLLARAFGEAVPLGAWAYRVNLFSAAAMSGAVILLWALLRRAALSPVVAALAAACFALAPAVVSNAHASEVFGLHALFMVAILWAAYEGKRLLAFYLLGLALGNHQTVILLLPGLLWLEWKAAIRRPVACALILVLGFSTHAFLYIRAEDKPFFNIGRPDTAARWLRVVRRADYGSLTLALGDAPARGIESTVQQGRRLGIRLVHETAVFGMAAAIAGLFFWRRRHDSLLGTTLVGFLFFGPFFFWLGNLPFDAQSNGILDRFLIAPLLLLIILAAGGAEWLRMRWGAWAVWLWVPFLFWQGRDALAHSDRGDFRVEAYWRNHYRTLPPGAPFIMDGGDDTFYSMAYASQVLRRRPDVIFHDRGGVVFAHPYGEDFRRLYPQDKEARRQAVESAIMAAGRPLYYSTMNPFILSGQTLRLKGILYQSAKGPPENNHFAFYDLRGIAPWMESPLSVPRDYRRRSLYPFYAYQAGIAAASRREWGKARFFLNSALRWGDDALWLRPNVEATLRQIPAS